MTTSNVTNIVVEINMTFFKNKTIAVPQEVPPGLSDYYGIGVPTPVYQSDDFSGYSYTVSWFCFAYFTFLAIVICIFSEQRSAQHRQPFLAGYLLSASTAVTASCYFFMASGKGKLYEPYAVQVLPLHIMSTYPSRRPPNSSVPLFRSSTTPSPAPHFWQTGRSRALRNSARRLLKI